MHRAERTHAERLTRSAAELNRAHDEHARAVERRAEEHRPHPLRLHDCLRIFFIAVAVITAICALLARLITR